MTNGFKFIISLVTVTTAHYIPQRYKSDVVRGYETKLNNAHFLIMCLLHAFLHKHALKSKSPIDLQTVAVK